MLFSSRLAPAASLAAIALATGLVWTVRPAGAAEEPKMPTLQAPVRQDPTSQPRPVLTPDQVPEGALVPSGPPPAVVVFATGDVIGYLEPCG